MAGQPAKSSSFPLPSLSSPLLSCCRRYARAAAAAALARSPTIDGLAANVLLALLMLLLSSTPPPSLCYQKPHSSTVGMAGATMRGDPMPATIAVLPCCCPQTLATLFRDDVLLPLLSSIVIVPHPHHPPRKPFLIVEYVSCQLWCLYSGAQPPNSINKYPPNP